MMMVAAATSSGRTERTGYIEGRGQEVYGSSATAASISYSAGIGASATITADGHDLSSDIDRYGTGDQDRAAPGATPSTSIGNC